MAVQDVAPFGELLRGHRRALGLTQEGLAERAGLSERVIREIEREARHTPRKETVQLLAEALGLTEADWTAFEAASRRVGEPGLLSQEPGAPPRTNLPDEVTPFIGRKREIAEVVELLGQPGVRLVTLTGTGGTGKTRLAVQVAGQVLPQFEDGVFFVSLAPLSDPELVPAALAEAVGVNERGSTSLMGALTASLKSKRLLLVLDNLEHLLDATPLIGDLLDACRPLHLLVTSRIPLHLAREHEYAVPSLSIPDPHRLPALEQLCQYEAVALFCERARAGKASFALTEENAPAVAEICSRLDGLPLAIVLAAACIKLFPPQSLLQRLSSRLKVLTGGARDLPVRQQTLRATIDWSYGLLSEEEQRLFARLSVFAGGCTLEGAEAVCNAEGDLGIDVLEGIASLVDHGLLRQEGQDEPRFGMLETIREYAAGRLPESGAAERLRRHHANYFLSLAEVVAPQLQGRDRLQWLNRLAEEHDNLRAALSWAQEHGEVELGLRLAVALSRFWEIRGYLTEGRRWLAALLPDAELVSPTVQAAALAAAGCLAAALGNREEAVNLLERSLVQYRQVGAMQSSAEVLDRFAFQCSLWQDVPKWVSAVEEHLAFGRRVGDKLLVATSLHWLAWTAVGDNAERAKTLGEESLALYRDLDDDKGMVDALLVLMAAAYDEGDVHAGQTLYERIGALLPRVSSGTSTCSRMQVVAFLARDRGDYEHAIRLLEGAAERALEMGDRRNAAHLRKVLALLTREQGAYGRAAALYQESLAVFQEIEDRYGTCCALLGVGDVARDRGDAEGIIVPCRQALELGREIGDPVVIGYALHNLALAARVQGQYPRAEALLEESLAVSAGLPSVTTDILSSVGLVALDQGQLDRAEGVFIECIRVASNSCSRYLIGTLLEGLAGVAVGWGLPERATRLFGAAGAIRSRIGVPIRPVNQPLYEQHVEVVRVALEEKAFQAAWEEGQAMTEAQAIAYALGETGISQR